MVSKKAPRNRTITLSEQEIKTFSKQIIKSENIKSPVPPNTIIQGNIFEAYKYIPDNTVDLLFLDPPYNLSKQFHSNVFNKTTQKKYSKWFRSWFELIIPKLKNTASIYVCGDWHTSLSIYEVINEIFIVQNRITWEREKGRGAKSNFKNSHEDIWFATRSSNFKFNVDAIKLKRKVIAPYKVNGNPKDWQEEESGNFRLTHPSNLWTDISIPFWSMPENTIHPTQKPEKLLAKLILASTDEGDIVFDPFLGSGTTAVVAKKLKRNFYGIELTKEYIYLALKRLELAEIDSSIQGYSDGVFWERNTLSIQKKNKK